MRITEDDIDRDENDPEIVLYQGEPYTGTVWELGPNGEVWSEMNYKGGIPHGVWRGYYPNGRLESEDHFDMGAERLRKRWYDNGQIKEELSYDTWGHVTEERSWAGDGTPLPVSAQEPPGK